MLQITINNSVGGGTGLPGSGGGGGGFTNDYSLAFDGIDDRVQLTSDFVASGEFTISFWMKPTTISGNGNIYVMGTFPNNDNYIKNDQIGVMWLRIGATTLIFSESYLGSLNNILVLNEWQNITFIRDSFNVIRCYRNGTSFGNPSTPPTNSNTLTLNSFGRIITNTFGFNGGLDEIAFWNTDETANVTEIGGTVPTDLTDLSPYLWLRNGDNGTWKSPQWLIPSNENKDKASNYSMAFDGMDDEVTTSSAIVGSDITLSYWVNCNSAYAANTAYFPISIARSDASDANNQLGRISLRGANGYVGMQSYDENSANYSSYFCRSVELVGTGWHNIVLTWNNSTKHLYCYIDGAVQTWSNYGNTVTTSFLNYSTFPTTVLFEHNLRMAKGLNGTTFFGGLVDEVATFDSVLSSEYITSIYGDGAPSSLASLSPIAWYRMGEEANFTSNWLVDNSALDNYSKRSFAFDGIDDYVDCGVSTFTSGDDISVSLWIKKTASSGVPLCWGNNVKANNFVMWFDADELVISCGQTAASSIRLDYTFNNATWYNIVVVGTLSSGFPTAYINGSPAATKTLGGWVDALQSSARIGGLASNTTFDFTGNIDEVTIFDSIITIGDVWDGSGQPIDVSAVSGIVSNYRMGEDASFNGTDWTVPDNVGTNNGTSDAMLVDALVGEAPNYSGGGISNGMTIEDRVGDAPNSTNNALSLNMDEVDRVVDTPPTP